MVKENFNILFFSFSVSKCCIIVDPSNGQIISKAWDEIDDISRYYTYRMRIPETMLDSLACGVVDQNITPSDIVKRIFFFKLI
jgi:hypothetical protein